MAKKEKNDLSEMFHRKDIYDVPQEIQVQFFNLIRKQFIELNVNKDVMPIEVYVSEYQDKIMDVVEMATLGIVPAMDFLCFLYKRGVEKVLSVNIVRAHMWGILAISNGSKLSVDRLRLMLDSVFADVVMNEKVDDIADKNELEDDDIAEFIAQNYCILLAEKLNINIKDVAMLPLNADDNLQLFMHSIDEVRPEILKRLYELIA